MILREFPELETLKNSQCKQIQKKARVIESEKRKTERTQAKQQAETCLNSLLICVFINDGLGRVLC
jgi:hypothetical protein